MATFGGSAYGLTIESTDGSGNKRSRTISGINYNATGAGGGSSALGADVDTLYEFGTDLLNGPMYGTSPAVSFTDKKSIDAE